MKFDCFSENHHLQLNFEVNLYGTSVLRLRPGQLHATTSVSCGALGPQRRTQITTALELSISTCDEGYVIKCTRLYCWSPSGKPVLLLYAFSPAKALQPSFSILPWRLSSVLLRLSDNDYSFRNGNPGITVVFHHCIPALSPMWTHPGKLSCQVTGYLAESINKTFLQRSHQSGTHPVCLRLFSWTSSVCVQPPAGHHLSALNLLSLLAASGLNFFHIYAAKISPVVSLSIYKLPHITGNPSAETTVPVPVSLKSSLLCAVCSLSMATWRKLLTEISLQVFPITTISLLLEKVWHYF